MGKTCRFLSWISLMAGWAICSTELHASEWQVGAAAVDVTPDYPVRLSGYGSRTKEVSAVKLRLWAKALALQWADGEPAVIVTVDNCGIPAAVRHEVLKRVNASGNALRAERFAICSSHTHSAPHVRGYLPLIFGGQITKEEEGRIDRHTADITGKLAEAVVNALVSLKAGSVSHGIGKVGFAMNRRFLNKDKNEYANSPNPHGPADHDLPVLCVKDAAGKIIAVLTSYACHCTTLAFDTMHGDWAGEAQREMELRLPGVVAMTAIGCGGDQNPYPRREYEFARRHGIALSDEACRVVKGTMMEMKGPLACAAKATTLPLETAPTKEEWSRRASDANRFIASQARHFLGKLDRGEPIPGHVPYEVQCWDFGGGLLMVNLPGEVVVDYSLRLKKAHGRERTWVNAYTNDVPCYIPSQRVWNEGGYEAAGAMLYYGWPARFSTGIEEVIFKSLSEIIPVAYKKE